MQKIMVCIKRVVDYNVRVRVKPDGSGVMLDGVKMSVNTFDEIALEEALRIKERVGNLEVLAVSIGVAETQQQLRTALAMGADRAILVQTDVAVEPLTAAQTLLALAKKENPDLIFLGKQAIDDDANQTGQMLAALWERPQATYASKVEIRGDKAAVTREVDAGLETIEVDLPAVISVALLGADTAGIASQAAALANVKTVVRVDRPENAHPLAATFAPQIAALAADYSHLLGPSTSFGKDLMPRVAALLGVPQVSDLMAVEGANRFRRPIYAGNAIVTVEADASRKLVATVRVASFEAAGTGGGAAIDSKSPNAALPSHTRYVGAKSGSTDRPDLQTASKVVSGGRALGSAENFKLLYTFADKIGAA